MVCQGGGAYCTSIYQSGVCQGGNACRQGSQTACNATGNCHCGTDIEGGGVCLVADSNLCGRSTCSTSGDCAYGKMCVNAPCCGPDRVPGLHAPLPGLSVRRAVKGRRRSSVPRVAGR
jgi:hypothetical protein